MEDHQDVNRVVAEFLASQAHCDALARAALATSDVDLAVFLQRLLATAAPFPAGSTQDAGEGPDQAHSPR